MQKALALLLLLGACVSAQTAVIPITGFLPLFPPGLNSYLGLTDDQIAKINDLNTQLATFQSTKAQRQAQVQAEIGIETAKESLDPMALGVRYLELEAIRRQLQAEQLRTVSDIQKLLTTAQQTKLKALQDALQLYPTGCDAIRQNLLPSSANPGQIFPANVIPVSALTPTQGIVFTSLFPLPSGSCISTPTLALRTGNFTPVQP